MSAGSRKGCPNVVTRLIVDDFGNLTLYRRCSQCRSWRPQAIGQFSPRARDKQTRKVLKWDAYCLVCRRAAEKAKRAARTPTERKAFGKRKWAALKADPQRLEEKRRRNREAQRAYRARFPEKARKAHREWEARVRADPARRARYLETQRIAHRLRMERKRGVSVTEMRPYEPAAQPSYAKARLRLPAAPLAAALERIVAKEGAGQVDNDPGASARVAVCARAGIHERQLFAWRTGEARQVHIDTADRVLVGLELNWFDVWDGEHYEAAARVFAPEELAA